MIYYSTYNTLLLYFKRAGFRFRLKTEKTEQIITKNPQQIITNDVTVMLNKLETVKFEMVGWIR